MKVQSTMLEMFMVTDDNGEVIAGRFSFLKRLGVDRGELKG